MRAFFPLNRTVATLTSKRNKTSVLMAKLADRALEKELLRALHHFYNHLEITDKKWKEIAKSVEKVFEVMKNYAEQLLHVASPKVTKAEIYKIDGLRSRLIYKIHVGMEEELIKIKEAAERLNNCYGELKNKLIKLDSIRNKTDLGNENMKELVSGTTYRPKLDLLLEWSIDSCDYYYKIHRNIIDCVRALNFTNEFSIQRLADAFVEPEFTRAKHDRILAFTQFLAREIYR